LLGVTAFAALGILLIIVFLLVKLRESNPYKPLTQY